ncbi:hypothetical protein Scep_012316 [Stephania cephalantha]|uniref:Uncharacterized protein n=1 Tax=Stephania cephalantha TaxID=152367 RepID=A0AAP0P6L6_9MAGN
MMAQTTATTGLTDVVATTSSIRRHRFDEASIADNGIATMACLLAKKKGENHGDLQGFDAF